jgi:hypothetical protein
MSGKIFNQMRSVAERLRAYLTDRRRILERGIRFEARLPFIVTLVGSDRFSIDGGSEGKALVGFTRNLSETGVTLLLPSVRIGDAYLTNVESSLEVKLELPGGSVAMLTAPVRFQQLQSKEAECGFLLAVRILRMREDHRGRYMTYLKTLGGKERQSPDGRKSQPASTQVINTAQAGMWEAVTPATINKAFEQFVRE